MNPIEVKQFLKSKVLDFMKENNLKYDTQFETYTFDETIAWIIDDAISEGDYIDEFYKQLTINLDYIGADFINFVQVQSTLNSEIHVFNIAVNKERY